MRVALRAGLVSVVAGAGILAIKFAAWLATGSTALLADASESIVNVIAAAMATYSVAVAARPADADHPYGHGKAESLSAAVEGGLIVVAAALIMGEAVRQLLVGPSLERLSLGIVLAGAGGVGNLMLGIYLVRVGRQEDSQAIEADGRHILADVFTTAGSIAALLAVRATGLAILDPLAGMLVALNIVYMGWRVVRRALSGLLDEADFDFLLQISAHLKKQRRSDWVELHQLRARKSGAFRHIDVHLVVPRYLPIEVAHDTGDALENCLLELVGGRGEVGVHVDPCQPTNCESCAVEPCAVRSTPTRREFPFDVDSLTRGGRI